jgi:hypothetical protein
MRAIGVQSSAKPRGEPTKVKLIDAAGKRRLKVALYIIIGIGLVKALIAILMSK